MLKKSTISIQFDLFIEFQRRKKSWSPIFRGHESPFFLDPCALLKSSKDILRFISAESGESELRKAQEKASLTVVIKWEFE